MTAQGKSPRCTNTGPSAAPDDAANRRTDVTGLFRSGSQSRAATSQFRWTRVGAIPIALVALACVFISTAWRLQPDLVLQAGPRDSPPPRQTELNNQRVAALGWVPNGDGTAIRHPEEVMKLVTRDGKFRTELALEPLADLLHIDPRSISLQSFPGKLDPDAILFKVVVGKLSPESKRILRAKQQARRSGSPDAESVTYQFVQQNVCFTLNGLKHPDSNQEMILAAISRAAREIMPVPGEKARAIETSRATIESGNASFEVGYLPVVEDTGDPPAASAIP